MFVCLLMPGLAAVFTRTQNRIALAELKLNKMRDNLYDRRQQEQKNESTIFERNHDCAGYFDCCRAGFVNQVPPASGQAPAADKAAPHGCGNAVMDSATYSGWPAPRDPVSQRSASYHRAVHHRR